MLLRTSTVAVMLVALTAPWPVRAELSLSALPDGATAVVLPDLSTSFLFPTFTVVDPVAGPLDFFGDIPLESSSATDRLSTDTPTHWSEFILSSTVGMTGISFGVSGQDLAVIVNGGPRLIDDGRDGTHTTEVSIVATSGDSIRSLILTGSVLSFLTDFRVWDAPDPARSAPEPATLIPAGLGVLALIGWGWRRRRQPPTSS